MLERLARLLSNAATRSAPDADPAPPAWVSDLSDSLQKSFRTSAKLALKLEDLERKVEGSLGELRSELAAARPHAAEPSPELFDALDLLEQAARRAELVEPALAEALRGVLARLESFLTQQGLCRATSTAVAPDPKLFRVVGFESDASLPDGVVARVVRAAVTRGSKLVREGEVLTNRKVS